MPFWEDDASPTASPSLPDFNKSDDPPTEQTGDADRGYTATDPGYVPPFLQTETGDADRDFGSVDPGYIPDYPTSGFALPAGQAEPLGLFNYKDPFYSPSPGHGMDPQLRDIMDKRDPDFPDYMSPEIVPTLFGDKADYFEGPVRIHSDIWKQPFWRTAIASEIGKLPPTMLSGTKPLRGMDITLGNEMTGGGAYWPGDHVVTTDPLAMLHELGHAADFGQGALGAPGGLLEDAPDASKQVFRGDIPSSDPEFRTMLFNQPELYQMEPYKSGWLGYGSDMYRRLPQEMVAEETARILRGQPTNFSPELEDWLYKNIIRTQPQSTWRTGVFGERYAPGSTADRVNRQYEDYYWSLTPQQRAWLNQQDR